MIPVDAPRGWKVIRTDSDTAGGWWGKGPSGAVLGLEASNLDPREENQKERWPLGEKARGRQTDERGGRKEGSRLLRGRARGSLCCSLVSDGQTEGGRGPGPDGS